MNITPQEVAETLAMVSEQNLDLRTITMVISLHSCADDDLDRMCEKVYERIVRQAEHLVKVACDLEREYGIPIANKRVSVTPIAQIAACTNATDLSPLAHALDRAAETLGIDFLGGFSALVHKGMGDADRRLIASIPEALATTTRVCSSVNVASTRAGINMDAVLLMAQTVLEAARRTTDIQCYGIRRSWQEPFTVAVKRMLSSTWAFRAPASWLQPLKSCLTTQTLWTLPRKSKRPPLRSPV